MVPISDIPTISMLAYKYGTIKKNEFKLVNELYDERPGKSSFTEILINQGFATEYQVGLLRLIQDYHIIQKQGIEFGKIAVKKGFATEQDIEEALLVQKSAFQRTKLKKLIGDILVESEVITLEQRDQILEQQKEIEKKSSLLVKSEEDSNLSEYEQEFLKIRNLDKQFAEKVISKQFATFEEINLAKKKQKKEFETAKQIIILGDILVSQGIISDEQKEIILVEQKRIEQKEKDSSSTLPRVFIAISDDNMEAHALIDKEEKNNKKITLFQIKSKLKHNKIKYGIFSDSLIQCYIDKNYTFFPVARGIFLLEYNNQAIKYFFDKNSAEKEQIKKGNSIAEQTISGKGLQGKDVLGNAIERDNLKNQSSSLIRCGFGTRLSQDNKKAFAKKTGKPSISIQNKLYIHPVLNILEDADLRYGKIEKYAEVNISGTLTDAFPVTTGNLKAKEIRGTNIKAHGNIKVALGITNAKIRCQGNIHAKYIRNSTIEAFGDVNVQHEIIDSEIIISGELKGKNARVIASSVSAKKSITIGSAGSPVTEPCILAAGRDDHIVLETEKIDAEIEKIRAELDEQRDQREKNIIKAEQLFKKMIQLKRFHDNTDKKKKKLEEKVAAENEKAVQSNSKNTNALLSKLKSKMKTSVNSLKALNNEKKKVELQLKQIERKIKKIEPGIEKNIAELERDRTMLLFWGSDKPGTPEINIKVKASETTILKGVFSEKTLLKNYAKIIVKESKTSDSKDNYSLKVFKG
ncbi:MAG: DUF342 domain-containing protein [Desulfobacteraceae bacterium]|nr:DUF342 domain-containing protein [Desulfobacteraceae bacterium]